MRRYRQRCSTQPQGNSFVDSYADGCSGKKHAIGQRHVTGCREALGKLLEEWPLNKPLEFLIAAVPCVYRRVHKQVIEDLRALGRGQLELLELLKHLPLGMKKSPEPVDQNAQGQRRDTQRQQLTLEDAKKAQAGGHGDEVTPGRTPEHSCAKQNGLLHENWT